MEKTKGVPVTTGQFLKLLYDKVLIRYGYAENELFARGRREGFLEETEEISEGEPLSRGAAARILHEVLRKVMKEADEEDWSAALGLADLFDCSHCVMHVVQIYAKGIMEAGKESPMQELHEFCGGRFLSKDEAELAVQRLLQPEKRLLRKKERKETGASAAKKISRTQAEHIVRTWENVLVVDVGQDTGEWEAPGKMQLPMMKLLENPFLLEAYRDCLFLLYCNGGYQSELAANCLSEHGYPYVFYFALK